MHNVIMEVYVCAFVFSSHQMRKMHIKCHFLMKAKHANKNSQLCTNVIERALSCVDLRFLFLVLIKVQERHESARSKWLFFPFFWLLLLLFALLASSVALYIQFLILLSSWCNQTKTRSERYLSMFFFYFCKSQDDTEWVIIERNYVLCQIHESYLKYLNLIFHTVFAFLMLPKSEGSTKIVCDLCFRKNDPIKWQIELVTQLMS